jgi:hypothetical protein
VGEAARLCGIGRTLMYRWIDDGRVVARLVVGRRLVLVASLREIADDPMPPHGAVRQKKEG